MSSPKPGQHPERPSVGSITYSIDYSQLYQQGQQQGHGSQPKPPQRPSGPRTRDQRQPAVPTARPRSGQLPAVLQANRRADPKTIATAPSRTVDRRGHKVKSVNTSTGATGSSSPWSSSSTTSSETEFTTASEISSNTTARIKEPSWRCSHALPGVSSSVQAILRPGVATNNSNSAREGGLLSRPWVPLTGAAVLTTLLVASAVATAAGLNRTALTQEDNQLPEPTPHSSFPVRDVGAGRASTRPPLPTTSGKQRKIRRLGNGASRATLATFWTRGDPGNNTGGNIRARGARREPSVSAVSPRERATVRHIEERRGLGSTALIDTPEDIWAQSFRIPAQPSCKGVLYTSCLRYRREFRYSHSANACVEAGEERGPARFFVCNRGPNRFSSVLNCERSCVLSEHPEDACLDQALFTACDRHDVHRSWWFFDGRACVAWDFPSGGCPADGDLDVFAEASECARRCTNPRYPPCRKPVPAPCTADLLKFPAFAEVSPDDGRVRCLQTAAPQRPGHRCLAGTNRFRTREACQQVCQTVFLTGVSTTPDQV